MNKELQNEQYVCLICGFNMVGYHPDKCPFCSASKDKFITAEECFALFSVKCFFVNNKFTRLNSVPSLGLEHSAYCIETND